MPRDEAEFGVLCSAYNGNGLELQMDNYKIFKLIFLLLLFLVFTTSTYSHSHFLSLPQIKGRA